uniref:Failed axon connections homolog n=1 Tax=Panagrellus redivivus TaxID=6233 RepID=A0A7E4VY09_PANRE
MILSLLAVVFIAFVVIKIVQNSKTRKLLKPDWQPDTVYYFQYNRPNYAPNMSPYGIKIESYLRANNIKYENVFITLERSSKGFVPFIELNGREYADTELILYELQKAFNVKDVEDAERAGALRGLMRTFDVDVFFIVVSFVSQLSNFEEICGVVLTKPSFWSNLFAKYYKRRLSNRAKNSSIGGFSETERLQVLERNLIAAENVLGNRKYFGGNIFSVADAAVYGQLAAVYLFPVPTPMSSFIKEKCPNLERYVKDVTNTLFSDVVTVKTQ